MTNRTPEQVAGMSRAALDVIRLDELREIAVMLWGHCPRLTKPKLVLAIWRHGKD